MSLGHAFLLGSTRLFGILRWYLIHSLLVTYSSRYTFLTMGAVWYPKNSVLNNGVTRNTKDQIQELFRVKSWASLTGHSAASRIENINYIIVIMARSTSASTTSGTPSETFGDMMSKFMIHSPLTWKKRCSCKVSFNAMSFASRRHTGGVKDSF